MKINEAAPGFWSGFSSQFKSSKPVDDPGKELRDRMTAIKQRAQAATPAKPQAAAPVPPQAATPAQPISTVGTIVPPGTGLDRSKIPAIHRMQSDVTPAATRGAALGRDTMVKNALGLVTPASMAASAGTNAMKPGNTSVPPTKGNQYTVIEYNGNKFFMDVQGQWFRYLGQQWPTDLANKPASQLIGGSEVDKLSSLIATKKTTPKQVTVSATRGTRGTVLPRNHRTRAPLR
jgi:hypothetical protein